MHQQINFNDFCNAFLDMGRDAQFTYAGKRALFDYLEAGEEESQELDVIALCCDYTEETYEDIAAMYSIEADDEDDIEDAVLAHLEDNTIIVGKVKGGFVFADF